MYRGSWSDKRSRRLKARLNENAIVHRSDFDAIAIHKSNLSIIHRWCSSAGDEKEKI